MIASTRPDLPYTEEIACEFSDVRRVHSRSDNLLKPCFSGPLAPAPRLLTGYRNIYHRRNYLSTLGPAAGQALVAALGKHQALAAFGALELEGQPGWL